jgi:amino acid adenylation domain-containing protein
MDVLAGRTSSSSLSGTVSAVQAETLRQQAEYWRETLADAPEPLELPADRPRPAQPDHAGACVRLELDAELTAALRALGSRHGAALPTTLLAGWAAVLGRLSGQTDLVIGTFAGSENPLPVRVDLSGSPTAAGLLGKVEARVQETLRNGDLPLERVVELVQPDGADASATPLFRAGFAWRDAPVSGPELPDLEPVSTAGLDLSLELREEEGGGVAGEVVFATALFDRETVERYAGYLRRVLAGMTADETRPVDRLTLLSAAERQRVTEEWNRTEAAYPESYIHERFEAQAARTPDAVAVVYEDRQLTYGELNGRANRLAHHLRGLGVGPDVRVGICVEREPELVVAVLGVLKAGGAYLPLDPTYPRERLLDMVQDSAPVVMLTQGALAGRLAGLDVPLLALDEDAAWWDGQPDTDPARGALTPEHLTYVIYTSGSTGRPKGVEMTHRGASNLLHWYLDATRITERDAVLVVTSFSFHLTQRNLLAPLFVGGRVHLAREPFEPGRLAAQIVASGISMMNVTPTGFQALVEADGGRAIGGLRIVVFGGEPLYPRQLARVPEPRPVFLNPYGSTEATGITCHHFARADLSSYSSRSMPPGRPIANARIYVLDAAGEPVPVGVTGELYLGGHGVTRGYRQLPGQTAERYLPDPFGTTSGARLYRTGDLGRWLPDGTIEFMGRADAQVKVRGFRIELGEIEARLAEHAAVHEVVVVARERDGEVGDPRLVAYYMGERTGAAALRAHLAERLPEYMVPAAFVHMDVLPVNPNGKLDRKALPAPDFAPEDETYVAPRTPVEEVLAGIWAEVLGVDRMGVEASFFDLGGHSLLATRVVSRVRELFGVELPLRALFEGPTVAEMARAVEDERRSGLPVLPPVVPLQRTEPPLLSFAQERLWFLDRLEPGSAFYNLPFALRLRGALDVDALERSLGEIVRRHEALRAVFRERDGSPVQEVVPFGGFRLTRNDLAHLPPETREVEVQRELVAEGTARPFDLAEGPLFRVSLLRLDAEEHVLLLSQHHIVSDGWSMGVLYRELSALYDAYRQGGESPLPALAVQYADYAVWQREQVEGAVLERQLAYWRGRLAGAPELLELPTDRSRPAVQTYRGATVPVELSPALLERLQALARSEGATLYMTLLSAFQVLLSKYAGSEDVVVGSPIAGRTRKEVEELIGFFVNTLVLRADLSGDPSFRELLRRAREVTLGAYAHQDVPFEKLVAELQPERTLSHSPLFQVLFTLQNAGNDGGALSGLRVSAVEAERVSAKFDLSLVLTPTSGGLRGGLTYSTDLFERGTVDRMLGHLERVLEQVAADADVPLSRLALIGPEERARVVGEWNRTGRPFPREACIHQLFQAQAERTPDAVALAWGAEEMTYRALDARANRLAHHLAALGVGPESRVGLRLERSLENVVATLAVLKAGGCCVPVDTSYPPERMALMLADSAVRVLLSDGELAAPPAGPGLHVVRLDRVAEALAAGPDHPPPANASAGNLAYVFYTSGSTGRPKGVMMGHRDVVQYVSGLPGTMPLGPGDRVAQASNVSFDAAVFEIWGALLNGATVVGIDRDVLLSAPALGRTLREEGITHLYQTAALFNQHVREQVDVYASLRQLVFGAEAVGTESVRRMLREGKPERVLHEYGPTEATVWCTLEEVEEVAEDAPTVLIGRPIPNARGYVLDPAGEPLPVGVPGELCIGGAGVVRGYLGRPALTAERFVPDPFAAKPGGRMYRTGDRARWKESAGVRECVSAEVGSGSADSRTNALTHSRTAVLEFMGRLDDQVKIRGFRIEPGEVEAAIAAYPGVREARVMMREDQPGDKRLVAYVVGAADVDGLRAHLRQGLPEYMVPRAIVALDRLPLNPNGKVDRKALPLPEYAADADRYVAPRTPAEEVLAGIWAEVLRLERVGVEETFFDLGGHSLLAIRVLSRIRTVFSVELPLRALFEGPTVAELAGRVEETRRAGLPVLPPVVPMERTGALPLSFAQQRLWFLEQLGNLGATYHVDKPLRLRGALDRAALARALDGIVRRHEALRTTFALVDGEPEQRIAPAEAGGFPLVEHDLGAEADADAGLRRIMAEEARAPFDLERGPLIRGRLVRLAADDHVLLVTMHHIVSDGWSLGVLIRELSALYAAQRAGREADLPALPVQYADYAAWQRRWVSGEVLRGQADYWKNALAGAPELLELPTDHPRPAQMDHGGARLPLELDEALTAGLKALSQRHGTTLFMTVLAGWATVLSRLSGQDDVVVGTPSANRGQREIEGLIGFFVNTLALRVDLSGSPTVAEVLARVKARALEAQQNQDIPFEQVVELVQPTRSLAHAALFQVMFAWRNAPRESPALPGLEVGGVDAGPPDVQVMFDLMLTLGEAGGRIAGEVEYATALFERETVERHAAYLRRVLQEMVAGEGRPVARLPLLPDAERRRVVEEWSANGAAYPAGLRVHAVFEAQAARAPGALALVSGDEELTYAALNARANRLAHRLRALGVGPDARVAVCVERGPEMVVALLGVLKAGGGYVPLDPAHPDDRMRHVLEDSAPVALLVQAATAGRFASTGVPRVALDAGEPWWAGEPDTDPAGADGDPRHLAYVIYTSGSTGRPKGVMVEHRSVCQQIAAVRQVLGLRPGERSLQFASVTFDAAVEEIFGALLSGCTLVLRGDDWVADAGTFWARCEAHGINVMDLPTRFWQLLAADPRPLPACVRLVLIGGEAVEAPALQAWFAAGGHRPRLLNTYGPTESTVNATFHEVTADPATWRSIGRPVPHTRAYLLDAHGEPVPVGATGEIHVGGGQVARGYRGRPGLTAERFVPDPFGEPGARLYRTGDLGRWRADGTIDFLGRNDFQVKVRGFRIELGEIEARLAEHPAVREAVVLVREDAPGEKRLVAYHVGGDAGAEALRAHLAERLPEYMVPAAYVPLERLPLTSSGKLDRTALPAPEGDAYASRSYEPPLGEVEAALAGIWSEVLRVDRVGRWDHFFELGGHSLLAIRLIERMRRVGLYADVRALFTTPVLAELARAVGRASLEVEVPANGIPEGCGFLTPEMLPLVELSQGEIDRIVAGVAGGAANVQDIYPLAPLQEGFLFHHLLSREGDPYLQSSVTEFDTRAGLDRYLTALQAVIGRHDILRTAMAWEGLGEPVQVVWRHAPLPVEEVELDAGADAAGQLGRRYDPRRYRMDLTRAPLLRACVAEDRARGRWLLLMLTHHLTGDHESLEVLWEEISAHLRGAESALPAPRPFRTHVAQARLGVSREEHERFFRGMLGNVDEPTAPYGMLDVWGEGRGIGEARLPLAGDLGARLRRRARALGVSAASLFHLAWAQVLARLSGRQDVVFGTLLFGRMQGGEGADRVMGPLINTLPVRIGVGEEGVEAAVRRTHGLLADLLRHEHASLALAQRCSGVAAPAPLFTSLLNYRYGGRTKRPQDAGQTGEGARGSPVQERTNYPVALAVDDRGDAFSLAAQVAVPADAERVCRMMHTALERLAEALEAAPGRPVGSIDVLPEAERRMVVEAWNRTDAAYPAGTPIHRLFEEQAGRTPRALAVVSGEDALTYQELNARANQLAHHLRARGVGPEARVAILVPRSIELVVSELAVLKAGAAYVPIDPSFPAERIAFMVADCGARVVFARAGDALPASWAERVDVDAVVDGPVENLPGVGDAGAAAYVMYTSGSTGEPKGVVVPHRAIARLVFNNGYADFRADDRVAFAANPAFDATTMEVWGPLLHGGRTVVIPRDVLLDPDALARTLAEQQVTTLFITTAVFNQYARAIPGALSGLRRLLTGGEAADPSSFARVLAENGPVSLIHCYGPTETTTFAITHEVTDVEEGARTIPLGRPIANTRIYVLDARGEPVPVGVGGELYIGGTGVALGYQGRPGLTAQRFVPDPLGGEPGARMYRTGDLGRWLPDGTIEFLGRNDHQVKVRGFRIELGEIEARLLAHPAVREAVVLAREDAPGDRRLVAYYVGAEGAEAETLHAHLSRRLPEYMVPSAFVSLDALPLAPTGKLDRKALPAPDLAPAEDRYVAPRTPVEEVLAGIWAEVLRLERVGVEESFFDLGGHSLLATRAVSRVREAFAVELPLRAIFESPTVAGLAPRVERLVLARVEEPELADALALLERLSEAEVMALLKGD